MDPQGQLWARAIGCEDALAFRPGAYVCVTAFGGHPVEPRPEWRQPVIASGTGTPLTTW
jgi:hypothetical protein